MRTSQSDTNDRYNTLVSNIHGKLVQLKEAQDAGERVDLIPPLFALADFSDAVEAAGPDGNLAELEQSFTRLSERIDQAIGRTGNGAHPKLVEMGCLLPTVLCFDEESGSDGDDIESEADSIIADAIEVSDPDADTVPGPAARSF